MSPLSKLLRAAVMLALAFGPRVAAAQKALVYCPVSIDATGCATIKTALTSAYPGGVDTGFDGTQGTVDLKTVDLFQYSVVVVPSLADDSTSPYALLRDATVASKLKAALLGRRAFWSGTPDQGVLSTTRPQKDALIQNLAAWASGDFATVNAPGLVVLQDNSADLTKRYDWVQAIAGFTLIADTRLASYSAVSSLTAAGNAVLSSNGSTLAYANMASMGFQTPSGAPGTSMDAVGKTGTGVGGQVVLITQSGANTGGAVVTTDKDDYAPGTTVVITGTGFGAGESVTLTLHEDPTIEPDFSFTTTADQNGGFVFSGFTPDTLDVDVRFVLTATGQTSGRRAQTTFTDGIQNAGPLSFVTVASSACTATSAPTSIAGTPLCAKVTVNTNSGNTAGNTAQFLWFGPGQSTAAFTTPTGTIPANGAFTVSSIQTPDVAGTWTVKLCLQTSACTGGPTNTLSSATIQITAATAATTLALSAPSPANVSFGSSGPVSISATLTVTSGGAPVSGASVAFTIDGGSIGSATTSASGVATISNYSPSALGVGSHTIVASFTQATIGGTTYLQSTSGNQTLAVGQASQTIAFGSISTKTFGDPDILLSATATSGLPVSYSASGNCTLSSSTVSITGAGSCTITANQAGNANYAPAPPVQQSFQINAATATLTIDVASLTATYDGASHAATVTTNPVGLTVVDVTYNGVTTAPTNAGSYAVVAKLTNANYSATDATGTLKIDQATPTFSNVSIPAITYQAPTATISGSVKAGSLPAIGTVGITVSGTGGAILGSASVDVSGNFSTTVNTAGLPANAAGYDVALVLPASANFKQASDNTQKLIVNKATQSITFGPLADKTYGDAPFTVSATSTSGLGVTFTASGNCSVSGNTVTIDGAGNCTVNADQAGDGNFQPATQQSQSFAIAKATATISVTGFSGPYDGAAHGATGSATGVGGTDLTASLNFGQSFTNVPGGTASWTFTGGQNYKDDAGTVAITITTRPISVTADPQTKVYGDPDPAFSYKITAGSLVLSDAFSGTLASDGNEGVGDHPIGQGTLALSSNYAITYIGDNLKITPRPITVTADPKTKFYGDPDPALTAKITTGNLVFSDALSGNLSRAGGENVGNYAIQQGGLTAGTNYTLTFVGANLAITPRSITVQPTAPDLIWTGSPLTPSYSLQLTSGSFGFSDSYSSLGLGTFSPATVTNVGAYTSTVSGLSNANYTISTVPGTVNVLDKSKPAGAITELLPIPLGGSPLLKANFNDVTTGNSNIVAWHYRVDNAPYVGTIAVAPQSPNVNVQSSVVVPTSASDVVQVCVEGQDAGGNWSKESCALLAIYDPSAGFVTGGGWIDSPAKAYYADTLLAGKANFGFVSKYQKGANVPTGNTEFQFKEGNLNFSSTSFQWLVIQGTTMSQFKGVGTINGTGSYNFLVTAIDGDQFSGTKKPDSFRIKITNGSTVVYDNQLGADETSASATTLGGGSIQIKSK